MGPRDRLRAPPLRYGPRDGLTSVHPRADPQTVPVHPRLDGMPCQDVDRASLAANLETHLGFGRPPSALKTCHAIFNQRCVGAVEEPIDRFASPVDPDDDPGLERATDPFDHAEPKLFGTTELEQRHCPPRDARPRRQVNLTPAAPVTQDPNGSPKADGVHASKG